jgi:hypothetical protein
MKRITIFSFLLIFLITNSCTIFEPKPESEKFYCKINGRNWRPEKQTTTMGTNLSAEWDKSGIFRILSYNNPEFVWIRVKVDEKGIKVGKYDLKDDSLNYGLYSPNYTLKDFEKLKSSQGSVTITKVENNYISGIFEFTTILDKNKRDYKIIKGQFNNLIYAEF